MHTKPFTLALAAMLTVVFIGCGDSKTARPKRTPSPSGETGSTSSDKSKEKQPEADTKVADSTKPTPTPGGEGWGNLKGKFIYSGKAPTPINLDTTKEAFCTKEKIVDEALVVGPDGGMANIAVWVKTPDVKVHPDYDAKKKEKVVINNEKCRFNPHVIPYWLGQPLVVKNSDPVSHNTNANLPDNPGGGFNEVIGANSEKVRDPIEVPEPRPTCIVSCGMHPWMKAWLVVLPHPYVAVSAADGTFEIKNLPAGTELEFMAWQEAAGFVKAEIDGKDAGWAYEPKKGKRFSFKYTIQPGDNDLGTIKLDASQFKPT